MTIEEMNEFTNVMNQTDISKFDISDQLRLYYAFTTFAEAVKPIYAKYAVKDKNISNFIIKL